MCHVLVLRALRRTRHIRSVHASGRPIGIDFPNLDSAQKSTRKKPKLKEDSTADIRKIFRRENELLLEDIGANYAS